MKFIVFILFPSVLVTITFADELLKLAIVVYRHGDRSPEAIYPNDPHNKTIWVNGLGQLTNLGKNQMYDLGNYIRNRYSNFLPVHYNEKDITVVSSDVSRTLMSAYLCLAGLYKPQGRDIWSEEINWQPIPVHSIPRPQDNLVSRSRNCTKHGILLQNYLMENSEKVERYYNILQEVFSYAGVPPKPKNIDYKYCKKCKHVLSSSGVRDCLFVEETHNLTLPEWTAKYYPQPLLEISLFKSSSLSATKEMCRLRSGPLLKEILTHFDGVQQGTLKKKMYQYSAHDQTIIDLLQCLNIYDGEKVPYASAIFLELSDRNNVSEVSVSYKKRDVVKELTIPGCNNMVRCPLDLFKEVVSDMIPEDWEKECVSV